MIEIVQNGLVDSFTYMYIKDLESGKVEEKRLSREKHSQVKWPFFAHQNISEWDSNLDSERHCDLYMHAVDHLVTEAPVYDKRCICIHNACIHFNLIVFYQYFNHKESALHELTYTALNLKRRRRRRRQKKLLTTLTQQENDFALCEIQSLLSKLFTGIPKNKKNLCRVLDSSHLHR